MKPSPYQQAVFDFVSNEQGSALIEAVAGSGKTTTIVQALDLVPRSSRCLFLAFNKHIAEELKSRAPEGVEVRTSHSFCLNVLRQNVKGYMKVDERKIQNILRYDVLPHDDELYYKHRYIITLMISLLKATYLPPTLESLTYLAERYGQILPEDAPWFIGIISQTFDIAVSRVSKIDFDDMIYLPVARGYDFPQYDYVFLDEAQDFNPIQIELVARLKVANPDVRVIAVGDSRQSIYGFRGADPAAMLNILGVTSATPLPLSICYRCGKNIVREAQRIVPHIEAFEGQAEGLVDGTSSDLFREKVTAGDYVLCRTVAPLVKECLNFIRRGIKAIVRGRDIGEQLLNLITEMRVESTEPTKVLYEKVCDYEQRMLEKYAERENAKVAISDRCDTLRALCDACDTVHDLIERINTLFSDSGGDVITFCSVHKSKGLEADRIFVLKPDLMPHPSAKLPWMQIQESNLLYVAITRAKKELYYVYD